MLTPLIQVPVGTILTASLLEKVLAEGYLKFSQFAPLDGRVLARDTYPALAVSLPALVRGHAIKIPDLRDKAPAPCTQQELPFFIRLFWQALPKEGIRNDLAFQRLCAAI